MTEDHQTARFILLEGGEGAGKSTQAKRLADHLGAIYTWQPGDSAIGAELRRLCLTTQYSPHPRTVSLMMAADRVEQVHTVIRPALERGQHVVCDRYYGSSIAYQGYGDQLGPDDIVWLSEWSAMGCAPDLVLYLHVPPAVAAQRLVGKKLDRLELMGDEYHARVRMGFEQQMETRGWVPIDGTGSEDETHERILQAVKERLGI